MSRGTKGSKRHMQDAVAERADALAESIGETLPELRGRRLTWVSPLAANGYEEFYDEAFLGALGLGAHRSALGEFWPSGGPNWDALATVEGPEGGVVLVEAKAHVGETPDPDRCLAKSPRSLALIEASLLRARAYFGVPDTAPRWTEHHYQVANRLAHLWWLHVECRVPTWLVLLGFTDSSDWRDPLTPDGWRSQVAATLVKLGMPEKHPLSHRVGVAVMRA
jgi:hypothetical protein